MHINYSHVTQVTSTLSHVSSLFNQSITHINQSNVTSLKVTLDLTLDVTCVAALEFEIRMRSQSHSGSGSLILN